MGAGLAAGRLQGFCCLEVFAVTPNEVGQGCTNAV